jgi:competence protein ComEC
VAGARASWLVVLAAVGVVALALAHREEIRVRAEEALGRGMPAREAALARGFVLGRDDSIDAATVEDFRRAGLSHLLAVSGQNVALLALLAMPLLATLGMPLRARLIWIFAAIVVYVPLAGAGPSILRAGVMGGLSVLATLAGRRASSLYALALAVIATLAIDPRLGADVGWQLSFAAVLGILALASPLRRAISARIGARGWRRAFAEGAAMTIAASLATAPLVAFHFEAVSTTTLIANLLALPAVAPAMWLGMLVAVIGQVPGFPVALLNAINAPLLAYIAQVAFWCGKPRWAYPRVELGFAGLFTSYLLLIAASVGVPALLRRGRLASLRRKGRQGPIRRSLPLEAGRTESLSRWRWGRLAVCGVVLAVLAATLALAWSPGDTRGGATGPAGGFRVTVLDVGQGDAILLQPARAPAVLVDGGPPGAGLVAKLHAAGVERLGAVVLTHEQSDHAGGIGELLGQLPVARLAYARLGPWLRARATAIGATPVRVAAGDALRSGRLRIEVLWPPQEVLSAPLADSDPNTQSLVLLARWRGIAVLLSGDAEAEAVPIDPGPVDVLKVAHHGSEDAGLAALLDRVAPRLAVISVGADNPFGHPAPSTLATLAAHGIAVLRTDRDGALVLEASGRGLKVLAEG